MEQSPNKVGDPATNNNGVEVSTQDNARGPAVPRQGRALPSQQKDRTPGLKIFDNITYTLLNNTAVFIVSVAATYLTMYGNHTGGKVGRWFHSRGEALEKFLTQKNFITRHLPDTVSKRLRMGEKGAKATKMVAFSFIDGSVMAPVVKVLEDHREPIARGIDRTLGTEPSDDSVYDAEPNQTWGSVLAGRAFALATVLPTAIMLGKIGTKNGKWIWNRTPNNPGFSSLNDHMFHNPGTKLGHAIEKRPKLARWFGKLNIPVLMSVSLFEAFYTSVCTAALYFSSREIAGRMEEEEKLKLIEQDKAELAEKKKMLLNPESEIIIRPEDKKDKAEAKDNPRTFVQAETTILAQSQKQPEHTIGQTL